MASLAWAMQRVSAPACALAALAVGAGCGSHVDGDDPVQRSATPPASIASQTAPQTSASPAPPPSRRWDPRGRPAIGRFVGDDSEDLVGVLWRSDEKVELFAVDGATGRIAWARELEGAVEGAHPLPLAAAGGLLAWAPDAGRAVHVVDPTNGAELRVLPLEPDQTVTRMCASGSRPMMMIPQPDGYDALLRLEDGRQVNNSGLYPRPACTPRGPDRDVPSFVRERLPPDVEIGDVPAYAYQPGHVVLRHKTGRADPVLAGLGAAGQVLWQTPLGADRPAPLRVVDVRAAGATFAVMTDDGASASNLLGVDAASGAVRWTKPVPCRARWLQATDTRVYAATEDGRLHVWRDDGSEVVTVGDGGACPAPAAPASSGASAMPASAPAASAPAAARP